MYHKLSGVDHFSKNDLSVDHFSKNDLSVDHFSKNDIHHTIIILIYMSVYKAQLSDANHFPPLF